MADLAIPQYDGLESSYEDIVYSYFRFFLKNNGYTLRVKRTSYIELDSIIPSASAGNIGKGSCDGYFFSSNSKFALTGMIELESTGKIKEGIAQILQYAKGFTSDLLSLEQRNLVAKFKHKELSLIVYDGKRIYISKYNLITQVETVIINKEVISQDNLSFIMSTINNLFPAGSTANSEVDEKELIKTIAKIIRGHEKLQKSKALMMTLLSSIYGSTGEVNFDDAIKSLSESQSDYDMKLNHSYKLFKKEIIDTRDKAKIVALYEKAAIKLFELSKDRGMDLYGFIYEELASKENKKEQGEYYTPRHTIKPIIKSTFEHYLQWDQEDLSDKIVLDPFCGSGGFLYEYVQLIKEKFDLDESSIDQIAGVSLWGFDKNYVLGAYLNLFLAGDGSANIHRVKTSINWRNYFAYKEKGNSLQKLTDPKSIKHQLKANLTDINNHLKVYAGSKVQLSEREIDKFLESDDLIYEFIEKN